jgi:hypothetical protein
MEIAEIRQRLDDIQREIDVLRKQVDSVAAGQPPTIPNPQPSRKFSASFHTLNMSIVPPPLGSQTNYILVDFFTTQDGSWIVGEYPELGIEYWAKAKYESSIPGAGADHHLFGLLKDRSGHIQTRVPYIAWTPQYDGNEARGLSDPQSGWFNLSVYASSAFDYKSGAQGIWAWGPSLGNSEILMGGGMPIQNGGRQHVSFFAVWQEV